MKNRKKSERTSNRAVLAALLVAATTSVPALADDDQTTPFTMAVIIGGAEGDKVEAGHYEKAIDRITRNGRRMPRHFAGQVNLCVAYTKTHEIQKANVACEAAIAELKKQDSRMSRIRNDRNMELRAYKADLALALSNRGVLLAATGDTERARRDFQAALELRTGESWIFENNLRRVNQESAS
jgi:tetratricopeptide (TPR) repeat protein